MAGLGIQCEWARTEKGALKRIEERHRENMDYRTVILDRGIAGKVEFIDLIARMNRIADGLTAIADGLPQALLHPLAAEMLLLPPPTASGKS